MKIVIPGGSGQVGTLLSRSFHADGHEVVVLSRRAGTAPWRIVRMGRAHPRPLGHRARRGRRRRQPRRPERRLPVHAGQPPARSWTPGWTPRGAVGEAIARAARPPRVWLQASTATIYAHRYDAPNDEATGMLGGDEPGVPDTWRFSISVAKAWERTAGQAVTPRTRQGADAGGHGNEPRPRRRLRHPAGPGPTRPRRTRRRRPPVRLLGPRPGLRPQPLLAHRPRRPRRPGESRLPEPAALRRFHARLRAGVRACPTSAYPPTSGCWRSARP